MNNLLKQLKSFRAINPDAAYAARSRAFILSANRQPRYQLVFRKQLRQISTLGVALTMAIVLLFVVSSVSHLPLKGLSPDILTSLNHQDLAAETEQAGFQIQLAEAKYYKESTAQITTTLGSVFNPDIVYLDKENAKQQAKNIDALAQELTL